MSWLDPAFQKDALSLLLAVLAGGVIGLDRLSAFAAWARAR
jgi:hypothetical protein